MKFIKFIQNMCMRLFGQRRDYDVGESTRRGLDFPCIYNGASPSSRLYNAVRNKRVVV